MGAYKDIYGRINAFQTCASPVCAGAHMHAHTIMRACMCASVHECMCAYTCMCARLCMCACFCPISSLSADTHTHTHTHTCIIQDAVSVHTAAQPPCLWSQRHLPAAWYIYIYVYICIYVYMYMYIEQPPCLWSQRHLPAAWPGHPRRPPRLAGIPAVLCLHIWHI